MNIDEAEKLFYNRATTCESIRQKTVPVVLSPEDAKQIGRWLSELKQIKSTLKRFREDNEDDMR